MTDQPNFYRQRADEMDNLMVPLSGCCSLFQVRSNLKIGGKTKYGERTDEIWPIGIIEYGLYVSARRCS